MLDENVARQFIAQAKWTFAKTMPQWPHEYTVRNQNIASEFEEFVRYIRHAGVYCKKTYWTRIYLDVGEWYYWSMGAMAEKTRIINRARRDEALHQFSLKSMLG